MGITPAPAFDAGAEPPPPRMSGGRGFVREALVKALAFDALGQFPFFILNLVNDLFALWDANNETLHDKMCITRVVQA